MEPRCTTPLHDEVLGKTNDILLPSKREILKYMGKTPRYNETFVTTFECRDLMDCQSRLFNVLSYNELVCS